MANIKKLTLDWSETGITVYCIVRREVDLFLLDDADGTFAASPADPYLSLTEDSVIYGRYEVSESRQVWDNGSYTVICYKQNGGSPSPTNDTVIGSGDVFIQGDALTSINNSLQRILGLAFSNFVEDDIVRNGAQFKTSSILYLYDTKANADTHDKATGLIGKYNTTITYDGSNRVDTFKITEEA